ncbi:hypothetical protein VTJ83DRAFT_6461 [Remersonia thermophila]|uniref:INO80 complex subunit B-like conserved region domain-containing protein n=1 Tax=Remersonia thermophila TaxID=72144 RepID=A0ABR4D4S3_9PEZI
MSYRNSARRSGNGLASATRGGPSSSPASSNGDDQHAHLKGRLPSSKLRQATASSGSAAAKGRSSGAARSRGGKKSYVIESSEEEDDEEDDVEMDDDEEDEEVDDEEEEDDDDDDDDEPEEDEIKVDTRARFNKAAVADSDADGQMEDLDDEDAEGEGDAEGEEMDVDADADADAGGDIDMEPAPQPPTIKITKPQKAASSAKPAAKSSSKNNYDDDDDEDDDDELSELGSEPEDVTVEVGGGDEDAEGEEDEDVDAEGEEEEIEVGAGDQDDEDDDLLSDDDEGTSRADTPDLSKLTARQRAKLGDVSHEYMKLSDEVQAKKHFTAEELSMRRAEMARRRRNLSEKRNEEVKMETINKLLKKQAPKTTRKNALLAAAEETPDTEPQRPDPMYVRWVNNRNGSLVAVPEELLGGPAGNVFLPPNGSGTGTGAVKVGRLGMGKMVEEVS